MVTAARSEGYGSGVSLPLGQGGVDFGARYSRRSRKAPECVGPWGKEAAGRVRVGVRAGCCCPLASSRVRRTGNGAGVPLEVSERAERRPRGALLGLW